MTNTILVPRSERVEDVGSHWLAVVAFATLLLGCSKSDAALAGPEEIAVNDAQPATTTTTTTTTATTVPAPTFLSLIRSATESDLGSSWQADCPIGVKELKWVELSHWDNEGDAVQGALVVHGDHAADIVTVFEKLFDTGFPIQSLRPITEFDGDDNASMAANNSSGFNCREVDGRSGVWSQHAYGGAVDINPLVNPWVRGSRVDPPGGAPYVDRTVEAPGLIVAGDAVTGAFAAIGWAWGGDWSTTIDYQHFSHSGR
jgi:hypothetical protein